MSAFPAIDPTFKETVRAASVGANLTLSGTQTVDGVALAVGDRVLVKDQTTVSANGVYYVQSGGWTRGLDAQTYAMMGPGHTVHVAEGNLNKATEWECTVTGNIVVGTTNITYTRTFPPYNDLWRNPWDPSTLGDNVDRQTATSTLTQASGTLNLHGGQVLRAGITYSALNVFFTSAGSAVTHTWAGLVAQAAVTPYSARQLIAVSADTTSAPTANAFRTFTFGSAVTPTSDTPVWFAICLVATTTVPAMSASPAVANSALFGAAPILAGTSNTAQTTPLALNTVVTAPTAIAQVAYAYLS